MYFYHCLYLITWLAHLQSQVKEKEDEPWLLNVSDGTVGWARLQAWHREAWAWGTVRGLWGYWIWNGNPCCVPVPVSSTGVQILGDPG